MDKLNLKNVTLVSVECVDWKRLENTITVCHHYVSFASTKVFSSLSYNHPHKCTIDFPVTSKEEYSEFILKRLNEYIDTDFVLIVQHDSCILNPKSWSDEFLNYDYIGSPWWYEDEFNVGNGGFSLRSKKLLEMCANDEKITGHPEDHVICRENGKYLKEKGIRFAPESIAKDFSIEGNYTSKYGRKWTYEFGYHDNELTDISEWSIND